VQLDGSASNDPNGETITYAWTQEAGATVTLSDPAAPAPTFVAPTGADTLTFRLTVTDVFTSTSDTVDVLVQPLPVPDAAVPDAAPTAPDADLPDAAPPPPPDATPPLPDAEVMPPDDDDGGCGCRTDGQGSAGGTLLLAGVVVLGLRRRRGRG
jgi:MYXO-CTERM domain-containing protein